MCKYTPWTIPQSKWTPLLPGIEITLEIKQELRDAINDFDGTNLNKRLEKFNTRISAETMNTVVY